MRTNKIRVLLLALLPVLSLLSISGCARECEHKVETWTYKSGESCLGGVFVGSCSECDESVERVGTVEDHSFGETVTVNPTCLEGGYDLKVCSNCSLEEKSNETFARGHAVTIENHYQTCESGEYYVMSCTVCDHEERVDGKPALGHDYVGVEYVSDEDGHSRRCKRCGELSEVESHEYGNDMYCDTCGFYSDAEIYNVTIWVSELYGVAEQLNEQINAFMALNPDIHINATIIGVTAADAASRIIASPSSAPDIFCFSQDKLAELVRVGALLAPSEEVAENIKINNDAGSVLSASYDGTVYAYPMSADNGYYLYYDKSIISNPDSLEDIIAACEANNKKLRFNLENAWYTASFFFATGCGSEWLTNEAGEFIGILDDFNSENGLVAMRGMRMLAQSSCYDSNSDWFGDAGAIVTGVWNKDAALAHFGANLGAADLPSFTVDGQSYHLGSYCGTRLMGVKPETDDRRAEVLSMLAQYLTGEECQTERYESFNWIPSNKAAQSSDAIKADISASALIEQNEYATPQGNICGAWWDIARILGAEAKKSASDDDLKAALDNYDFDIAEWIAYNTESKNVWSVIGSIGGTSWDFDFVMIEYSDGVRISEEIEMKLGDEFKVRQGLSWDNNYGQGGEKNGANIVVETSGTYRVQLTLGEDGSVSIELIPVE